MAVKEAIFTSRPGWFLAILGFFIFLSAGRSFSAITPDHFNGPLGAAVTNWSVTGAGSSFTYIDTTTAGIPADPAPSETSPTSVGLLFASGAATFESVTYTDPVTGPADNFIYIDVFTSVIPRNFDIIATDGTKSVTQSANNIVASCGSTLLGATLANQWNLLFINLTGQAMGNITQVTIVPRGNFYDNPVYFDNLRSNNISCSLPTPTPTKTFTPLPPTNTPTNSPTPTASSTATNSPTKTPTSTATNSPTITPTSTPTLSPTNTVPNTPTNTPTLTFTGTAPPTNTPTNTPTLTFTNTASFTPTNSPTNFPTSTFTNTFTFTYTFTITPTPTNTFTPTITNTPMPPTNTFTPTPYCPMNVYPDPMDYQKNPPNNSQCSSLPYGCIKFACIPSNSTLNIYTVSLMLVRSFPPGSSVMFLPSGISGITWDGTNGDGNPVSSGFYLYVVDGPSGRTFGKFAISRSRNGP